MATLRSLKRALLGITNNTTSIRSSRQPLSDRQHKAGFDRFLRHPQQATYKNFIIPEISYLLAPLYEFKSRISVLEVKPGPKSILSHLPVILRDGIKTYTAFEPNALFVDQLENSLESTGETASQHPFPKLESGAITHHASFSLDEITANIIGDAKHDMVLFCHGLYGMEPRNELIKRALDITVQGVIITVFHRDGALHIDGLVCHHTASFPSGMIAVEDKNEALDCFASFIAGFSLQETSVNDKMRSGWRKTCRELGFREHVSSNHRLFSAPERMTVFNRHATNLSKLTVRVPCHEDGMAVKNREARLHCSTTIVQPQTIQEIQHCVKWALKHGMGLTVVAGGHSAHCLQPNVVAVDMSNFRDVDVLEHGDEKDNSSSRLVVVGTGCKANDIVGTTMAAGLTVPLGSHPSVGAGLWLLGGIVNLIRQHGLTCDSIVGAVLVSVTTGEIFYVGHVPEQHRPMAAALRQNETDILWAIRGAGTNFGIVVYVTLKAYPASTYQVRNWVVPLADDLDTKRKLAEFDSIIASTCDRNSSANVYLYYEADRLNLGVTTFESTESSTTSAKTLNARDIFNTEMYMPEMHGGHGGEKTSSFKRCIFLKNIRGMKFASRLVAAIQARSSPICYLHLLHGGEAVGDTAADATAFGYRDLDFACVVTGVWPRNEDSHRIAVSCVQWVYDVINDLLPLSEGVYGADLGPDPRDALLAAKAFESNTTRLGRLKRDMDPKNVLAYNCPLPKAPSSQLIILVTGDSCAGKDHCAKVWVSVFNRYKEPTIGPGRGFLSRAVSISDATKRECAEHAGADLTRLLEDRTYKE